MSKSDLSLDEIGLVETWLLIVGFFTFFWIIGFSQTFLSQKKLNQWLFFKIIFSFSLVSALFASLVSHLFTELSTFSVILLGLNILLLGPSSYIEYQLLKTEKSQSSFLISSITFGLSIVLAFVAIFKFAQLEIVLLAITLATLLRFIIALPIFYSAPANEQNSDSAQSFLKLSYPLILATLIGGGAAYLDGFLVLHFFENDDLAIFRYGAREFPLFLIAASSLSNVFIKNFSEETLSDTAREIKLKSQKYIFTLFPIAIVLMWSSTYVFQWVFSPEFEQSAFIFNVYLLTLSSRFLFPQSLLIGAGKNRNILKFSVVELLVNLLLSIIFLRLWGLVGIAIATVAAFMLEKILLAAKVKKELGISFYEYTPVATWTIGSIILLASFCLHFFIFK